MISVTEEGDASKSPTGGKILYRASHVNCIPFPISGDNSLMAGIPRNYEVFDPLDFLAEVTQHIPNKGEHQIRYYGAYSNKSRGMKAKAQKPASVPVPGMPEAESSFVTKHRMTWAALIKILC